MRWCLPLVCACLTQCDAPPPRQAEPNPAKAVAPARPARSPGNAGSQQLGTPCGPLPSIDFVGAWNGTRPFDAANPLLHRGPTRVVLTAVAGKIHYSEGTGAAATEVDLTIDPNFPNYALGEHTSTKEMNAISLDGGAGTPSTLTIKKIAELAICLDGQDRLHVGRRLAASGAGIEAQDEADLVILERER